MKKLMVYLSSIVILLLIVISQFSNNKILEKNSLIQQIDFSKITFSSGISTNTYENKNDVWRTYKDIEVNSNFKKYMFNLLNSNIIEIYDSNKLRKEKFMGNEIFSITLYDGSNKIERIKVGKIDWVLAPQVTSPLRTAEDINRGIDIAYSEHYDSLFSCSVAEDLFFWEKRSGKIESANYDWRNRISSDRNSISNYACFYFACHWRWAGVCNLG